MLRRTAPLARTRSLRQTSADAAVKALRRTERLAANAGVELTQWEGEFLDSVAERVTTYGRAFGDPEKGPKAAALSHRKAIKLKQIAKKVRAERTEAMAQPEPEPPE
jgi:hypothetical protein